MRGRRNRRANNEKIQDAYRLRFAVTLWLSHQASLAVPADTAYLTFFVHSASCIGAQSNNSISTFPTVFFLPFFLFENQKALAFACGTLALVSFTQLVLFY
jgi:hypothetical protein